MKRDLGNKFAIKSFPCEILSYLCLNDITFNCTKTVIFFKVINSFVPFASMRDFYMMASFLHVMFYSLATH